MHVVRKPLLSPDYGKTLALEGCVGALCRRELEKTRGKGNWVVKASDRIKLGKHRSKLANLSFTETSLSFTFSELHSNFPAEGNPPRDVQS